MLAAAEQSGRMYEESIQKDDEEAGPSAFHIPWEVKREIPTFHVRGEFEAEIRELLLPQFTLEIPHSIFQEEHFVTLDKEALSEGFTLKGKPSDIDFASADAEIMQIDIRDNDENTQHVYKMESADQQLFKEYFSKLPPRQRIEHCKAILHQHMNKLNTVDAGELRQYIDRIVEDMTEEQLIGLEKSPLAYAEKIKEKIDSLLEEHAEKKFFLWLETGKISCREMYALPDVIHPAVSTSLIGGSLYEAEEEMNGLERKLVMELTAVPNVRWWHRNISKREFALNGFIMHYPDLIIRTE